MFFSYYPRFRELTHTVDPDSDEEFHSRVAELKREAMELDEAEDAARKDRTTKGKLKLGTSLRNWVQKRRRLRRYG